jgi:hypothetical protein
MKNWYHRYFRLLSNIANSRWPAIGWIWFLLLCSCGWTGFWLFADLRLGGELLLPLLLTLWILIWLFIRLVFNFQPPLLPGGSGWRLTFRQWWFYGKLHGTACLILLLISGCLLISLKLATVIWRSFG